ncbi:LOW QUALITY PROTEIN: alpha-(1,3)-fucosyltransferase C-like [Daphnia carinata]|uniref:LOW QUALITY PROTEIN: alpha-(1,3)-fucosyltransferase C-like n=1 Tax=Daphnia carinata TaxID=120202 RepID=UPI00257A89EC|nr:LOW QUALITY PROTEIN: alpha-(1,3)-fucosyltransferase C-like [Daphnia carinata]
MTTSAALSRWSRKSSTTVLLYALPLVLLIVLTGDNRLSRSTDLSARQVAEIYEDDHVIIAGVGNQSQYAYWDRPDREVDLALIRGDEKNGKPALKTILFWNGLFYYPDYAFGRGRQPFIDAKCPVTTCLATDDPYLLDSVDQYDAVMFHWPSLCDYPYVASRSEHQLFVMVSDESPQWRFSGYKLPYWKDFFNLTMTYRRDSDIEWPYGQVEVLPSAPIGEDEVRAARLNVTRNYAAGKSKLAVWFVSHCKTDSRREFYVHVLKQHSRIDIFGKCGKPFCSFDQLNDCYERIELDYKFYLSFENSLCRGYITEKFFNLLDRNIVPIVYGAGNYEAIAPPHSYIDALKYTPVQLAKYLDILDKNDTLYNEYFWWKPFYKSHYDYKEMANIAFCQLCQQLNHPRTHLQWYHDIDAWYDGGNHCHKPNRFKVPIKQFDFDNYTIPANAVVKIPL